MRFSSSYFRIYISIDFKQILPRDQIQRLSCVLFPFLSDWTRPVFTFELPRIFS